MAIFAYTCACSALTLKDSYPGLRYEYALLIPKYITLILSKSSEDIAELTAECGQTRQLVYWLYIVARLYR